jgi:hypothetical protein
MIHNERVIWFKFSNTLEFPWYRREARTFGSGREALVSLIRSLHLGSKNSVLIPGFVPEGIIAPCQLEGLKLIFYPIDRALNPKWESLAALVEQFKPSLAFLIHYFGVVRDSRRFFEICHREGTLVLEDLAHAQKLPESTLGDSGDFRLHSLGKLAGVPDGAVLETGMGVPDFKERRQCFSLAMLRSVYISASTARLSVTTLLRALPHSIGIAFLDRAFTRLLNPYRFLMGYYSQPVKMSPLSGLLLRHFPWREAVAVRCRHEWQYHEHLNREVFHHLTSAAETTHCGMGFAVLVQDRESLVAALNAAGIRGLWFVDRWDYAPPSIEFDDARWVMRHHFLFPTAYSLSVDEVRAVIRVANSWASGRKRFSFTAPERKG